MIFPLFNVALLDVTNRVYNGKSQNARFICSPAVDNCSLILAEYISKCLPAMKSMAYKNRQDAIGHIGQIKGCFTKVPPCGRARFKTLWKRGHICPICPVLFSCPVITHWTDFLQHASHNRCDTLSANRFRESCAPRLTSCRCF